MAICLRLLPLAGCIYLTDAQSAAGQPQSPGPRSATWDAQAGAISMRALWSVSRYVMCKRSTVSEQQARSYLFKALDLTPSEITFDGRSCRGVHFRRESVAAASYLRQAWQVTPEELGIEEREVELVKTDCTLPGFQEYLRLRDNRLVIEIDGIVLFFQPVVTY